MRRFFDLPEVSPLFDQFALHERLLKAVAELKFVEPTPVQVAAIPPALEGRDLRVTAQTGSGKTAAFVLPMLNRLIGDAQPRVDVRALILLPTRELAQQTLKEVERFSQFTFIKSGLITGGEDFKVQAANLIWCNSLNLNAGIHQARFSLFAGLLRAKHPERCLFDA